MVENDGCKRLPRIEIADAKEEKLIIPFVSQSGQDAGQVRDIV